MPPHFYPTIDDGTEPLLQSLFSQMMGDPSYLEKAPYSPQLIATLRKFTTAARGGPVKNIFEGVEDKTLVIDQQIEQLISDLNDFAGTLSDKDHSEVLAYYKAKASLLEKLISMRERVHNLKEMASFQQVVHSFLDEICSKDQVSELMKRLEQ